MVVIAIRMKITRRSKKEPIKTESYKQEKRHWPSFNELKEK